MLLRRPLEAVGLLLSLAVAGYAVFGSLSPLGPRHPLAIFEPPAAGLDRVPLPPARRGDRDPPALRDWALPDRATAASRPAVLFMSGFINATEFVPFPVRGRNAGRGEAV